MSGVIIGGSIYPVSDNHLQLPDYSFALDDFFRDKRQEMQAIYQDMTRAKETDPNLQAFCQAMLQKRNITVQTPLTVDTVVQFHIEESIDAVEDDFNSFYKKLPDSNDYEEEKERQIENAKSLFKRTFDDLKGESHLHRLRIRGS